MNTPIQTKDNWNKGAELLSLAHSFQRGCHEWNQEHHSNLGSCRNQNNNTKLLSSKLALSQEEKVDFSILPIERPR